MKRTAITAAAVLAAVVLVYLLFDMALRLADDPEARRAAAEQGAAATGMATGAGQQVVALPPGEQDAAGLRTVDVTLYFSRPDGAGLAPETRPIFETRDMLDRLKQTVAALIAGPTAGSPLLPILPQATALRGLFLDRQGTLYLDLGQGLVRNLVPGTSSEILAVGGLTNTLAANFPEVKQVRFLVEGDEVSTLTGHLDLTHPMRPDPGLIVPPEVLPFPDPDAPAGGGPGSAAKDQGTIW